MWHGLPDYEDGLNDCFDSNQNSVNLPQLLNDGMGSTVPYCDLSEKPKARSQLIVLFQEKELSTVYSHLIISQNYKQKWLGNSTAQLSASDRITIHTMMWLHTVLQSGKFTLLILVLLVFGMLICRGWVAIGHSENLHPKERYSESH